MTDKPKNAAAVALGRIRSDKKTAAAQVNGRKGGRPVTWYPAPKRGMTNTKAETSRYTIVRNADRAERFVDRKPRPEIIKSLDFTVWDNRENREVR